MIAQSNLSVFEQNVFHAFRGASEDPTLIDEAEAIYLRHCETHGRLAAEQLALEWLWCGASIVWLLQMAAKVHGRVVPPEYSREFIRDRWYHYRFPSSGNGKTPFKRAA